MAGLQDDTLRIVLVGRAGSGKSATANTILGRKEFDSRISAYAVTKSCQRGIVAWKGRKLLVVDTPGLFDTKGTLTTTCEEISRCVLFSIPGPHAIILVVPLGRFTEEEQKTVELIKVIFGKPAMKYMVILFTHKEDLDGQRLSDFIAEAETDLQRLVEECGNRCLAFSNRRDAPEAEKEAQVQELVELIEEMVRGNRGSHFSHDIYRDTEEELKRQSGGSMKICADQLEKEIRSLKDQYAHQKISLQEMEEEMKSLNMKYDEDTKKNWKEAESSIFKDVVKKIQNILSDIRHMFWK